MSKVINTIKEKSSNGGAVRLLQLMPEGTYVVWREDFNPYEVTNCESHDALEAAEADFERRS